LPNYLFFVKIIVIMRLYVNSAGMGNLLASPRRMQPWEREKTAEQQE
jgi:hypothetical protein